MDYCVICGKPNNAFNYGIYSCNACTMFFRRAIISKQNFIACVNANKCYEESPFNLKCRLCRFQKCLHCGMKKTIHSEESLTVKPGNSNTLLSELLVNLNHREDYYMNMYLNYAPVLPANPSVKEVVCDSRAVQLFQKPADYPMDLEKWSTICQYTTIEFIKSCDFVKLLNPADQYTLINAMKMKYIFLKFSAITKLEKKNDIRFPGGVDFLPISTGLPFEHNYRYRMLGRLIDLDLTKEEYLLFGMLLLCNPSINGLSEYAKTLIASYQHQFSNSLLQYCQSTYQSEGPARFSELLSLFHVIERGFKDMESYTFWIKCKFPQFPIHKLVTDSFESCRR